MLIGKLAFALIRARSGVWRRQPRGGIVLVVLIETHSLPTRPISIFKKTIWATRP